MPALAHHAQMAPTTNMPDYAKMKNADLEALLKERSLPHTGKKADLVKRLQDDDAQKAESKAPSTTTAAPDKNEDEIDWDDEPATTDAPKPANDATAAVAAAGGQTETMNPQAVPNQVPAVDPAATDDLTVKQPAQPSEAASTTEPQPSTDAAPAAPEKEKTPVDFSMGLAKTTIDQEIEKRKARAKKFGTDISNDETLKKLERAKKFGTTEVEGALNTTLGTSDGKGGRRDRKRAHAGGDDAGNPKKQHLSDAAARKPNDKARGGRAASPKKAAAAVKGYTEADRAKAEARKAKFA